MDLVSLKCLRALAETGSIRSAAEKLGVSRATVRRRIEELQGDLGIALIDRATASGAQVTDAGQALADRAQHLLADAAALSDYVKGLGGTPRTHLRIARMVGAPALMSSAMLGFLLAKTPHATVDIHAAPRPVELLGDKADIAVTMAHLNDRSAWHVDEFQAIEVRLVASEHYLRNNPVRGIEDLQNHPLLVWRSPDQSPYELPLLDGSPSLRIQPSIVTSDMMALRLVTAAHAGVAWMPDTIPDIKGPHAPPPLERVLDDIVGEDRTMKIVTAKGSADLTDVQDHRDLVESYLKQVFRFAAAAAAAKPGATKPGATKPGATS